jgi:hypothetical protein
MCDREAAEAAINKLHKNLIVNGVFLKVDWARPKDLGTDAAIANTAPTPAPEPPSGNLSFSHSLILSFSHSHPLSFIDCVSIQMILWMCF